MALQHGVGVVLVEDTGAGIQLVQELKQERFAHIEGIHPKFDKPTRMMIQTPMIEAGKVYIPHEATSLALYLHELAMFPKGKFDDQVDSTSQALGYIGSPAALDKLATSLGVLALHQTRHRLNGITSKNPDNWLGAYFGGA
jgi:phage terminase large subunit-like protein